MGHEKHYLQRPIDSPLPLRLSIWHHRNAYSLLYLSKALSICGVLDVFNLTIFYAKFKKLDINICVNLLVVLLSLTFYVAWDLRIV